MSTNDAIMIWTGRTVIISLGAAVSAFLWWQALEKLLMVFKIKRLVLDFYCDRLRQRAGRITTAKSQKR